MNSIRIALEALRANTLRSILTTLGIIIGVGSVIVMVAVGSGARQEVDRRINALGTNMLVVYPGSMRVAGRAGGAGTTRPLAEIDLSTIREKMPEVVAASGYLTGNAPVIRGSNNWVTFVAGVHDSYTTVRDWPIAKGRDFSPADMRMGARFALLGATVSTKLFGTDDPVGEVIRIRAVPFTIIGVLEAKGNSGFGRDQDDQILLPMSAARGRIVGRSQVINDQVGQMFVKFEDGTNLVEAQGEIENILRQRRRVQPGAEDDFSVSNLAEFLRTRAAAMTTMSLLLGATAAISLIVGGIGIMNIMLVSVTERTREIGLRMAVGGRRRDIMLQFLVEAVMLCLLGGLIGIGLGVGVAFAVAYSAEWPVVVSAQIVALALTAAAATGIFFGFFPARRAALLNPIDALRSE